MLKFEPSQLSLFCNYLSISMHDGDELIFHIRQILWAYDFQPSIYSFKNAPLVFFARNFSMSRRKTLSATSSNWGSNKKKLVARHNHLEAANICYQPIINVLMPKYIPYSFHYPLLINGCTHTLASNNSVCCQTISVSSRADNSEKRRKKNARSSIKAMTWRTPASFRCGVH